VKLAAETSPVRIDPVTFSVLLNRLNSITTEMGVALANTASSALLALTLDFSCCIYDRQGRQIAMKDALPIHTNSMHLFIESIVTYFGDDIQEGDLIACNDPYSGNTHIGDLATACPVFHDGRIVLWTAIRAHQVDVGAPVATSSYAGARDVWQEGLTVPPVKLYEAGRPRRDVIDLYLANLRWRDLLEGDLMAQVGATQAGARKCRELCAEFGAGRLETFTEAALDYAARRTASEIRSMPKGEYLGEAWLDFDADPDRAVVVRCAVRIHEDTIDISFEGSSPQVEKGVNASFAVMQAAGGIPVMMAIDPDIPHNEGCLRRVRVTAPPGSICNATYPAATALATVLPGDVMQEAVCRALAHAVLPRATAGSAHWSNCPMLSGTDPDHGGYWGHQPLNGGGGGGASAGADGWPLITCSAAWGGLHTAPVEHTELLHPVLIEEWEVEPNSMGLGEHIGGPGVRFSLRPTRGPIEMIYANDGLENPPCGIQGGTPGAGGGSYVVDRKTGRRTFLPGEVEITIGPDELWVGVSSGGGGYGSPHRREAERVRCDVRDGLYGADVAREVFGVVLSEGEEPVIDREASDEARRLLEAAERESPNPSPVMPLTRAASRWRANSVRPGDLSLTVDQMRERAAGRPAAERRSRG
jgi:N-methylhydantoinase B